MNNKFNKKNVAEDVRLNAALLKWIDWLTEEYIAPFLKILRTREFEKIKLFEKPKREKFKKNSLSQVSVFDTIFLLGSVCCALYTEILLSQTIFEKVLGIAPQKASYMGWGITAILFTGSMLIKPMVKDFLYKRPVVPRFFKIGMILCCCIMFLMGGLSFYNIQKNNDRKDIVVLSQRIEEKQELLEDDPSDSQAKQELSVLQEQLKTKMDKINNKPWYILGGSFLAMSLLSLVMLFCSSFLKAITVFYIQILYLKYRKDYYFKGIQKKHASYESLVSDLNNAYGLREPYLRFVGRKAVIEFLQSGNPVTSKYLKAINTPPDTPPSGLSTHHQTFTP